MSQRDEELRQAIAGLGDESGLLGRLGAAGSTEELLSTLADSLEARGFPVSPVELQTWFAQRFQAEALDDERLASVAAGVEVNAQITDSVTQANVKVIGGAPAMAMGSLYQQLFDLMKSTAPPAVSNLISGR